MSTRKEHIIMNGVTGRMGSRQHLERSILAIRAEGGLTLGNGDIVVPEPILVGRDAAKLERLAGRFDIPRWTTDLDLALSESSASIYFDAQTTAARASGVAQAIQAGKHVYCEKPLATDYPTAVALARLADQRGVKTGVVEDKLYLPGILHLRQLMSSGFFGDVLSVRGEFGYWVFDGASRPAQRPAWNYRADLGGGMALDMACHWQYLLEGLFGPIKRVLACTGTLVPTRFDDGARYDVTADDTMYALFELTTGAIAAINSSWCFRVYRDDLFSLQVDGAQGSAVAGLTECRVQEARATPLAVWDPDGDRDEHYRDDWALIPAPVPAWPNAFKAQWREFLLHVFDDAPFDADFVAGSRALQVVEATLASADRKAWVDIGENINTTPFSQASLEEDGRSARQFVST